MEKTFLNFIFIAIGIILVQSCMPEAVHKPIYTVNPIIGDSSYIEKFGFLPDENSDEFVRVQTHLLYAEAILRGRDICQLSEELLDSRNHLLDLLHTYALAGLFPINTKYLSERRPCFIDDYGNICAVGYLVEQTAGRNFAEKINSSFQYSTIAEMNLPELSEWISSSGFTTEEVAIIQPTYSSRTYTFRRIIMGGGMALRGIKQGYSAFDFGFEKQTAKVTSSAMLRYESIGLYDHAAGIRLGVSHSLMRSLTFGTGVTPSLFRSNNSSGYNLKPDVSISFISKNIWRFNLQMMLSYGYDFALSQSELFPVSRNDLSARIFLKWNMKTKMNSGW